MIETHPAYTEAHALYRDTLRRWVAEEIAPHVDEWDEAGSFPRELYQRAADIGLLGLGFPEQYGGIESDMFFVIIGAQELARAGAGGLSASLLSHNIGTPPIVKGGSEALRQAVVPEILAGRKISALAITEPGAGSDVANVATTAVRDGDHYVINGAKTFITSGIRADYVTVAVRTGGAGHAGVSLILVPTDAPGFSRTPLDRKMGWWCSDTATLYFDDCRVPTGHLLGVENEGFRLIMNNFNSERLWMSAACNGFAQVCLDEAAAYASERRTFGAALISHQAIRHKLADMAQRIRATQAFLEQVAWRVEQGDNPVADVCLLKNQATQTMEFCAREGVQIFGGAGYLRGAKVERIYREVRVNAIGGGAEEIMRDLAVRQMGL
ncbi:acyl-CoA dehydrogenase [Salinisphaera dokdonensis CL-ES53]|uniref:Acyl-CoA dehydrogenase n=1 Tax=Salinisphaera dokdonensis CL-ES53 TaxID=1304272 RepID=A0ABV2AXI1_9GAMM